jgi:4'-phosphopantetheinyl transferase
MHEKVTVDIWRIALPSDAAQSDDLVEILSKDEISRADSYRSRQARDEFIFCRAAMRRTLGDYVGIRPNDLRIGAGPNGKPFLVWPSNSRDLAFNLSHSARFALLAITWGQAIGIDIEHVDAARRYERLAQRTLSPSEWAVYQQLPQDARGAAFLRDWTRKEAYLKATGEGLSAPLDQISVGFDDATPIAREGWDEMERWTIRSLAWGPAIVGALAVDARDIAIRWFDLDTGRKPARPAPPAKVPA